MVIVLILPVVLVFCAMIDNNATGSYQSRIKRRVLVCPPHFRNFWVFIFYFNGSSPNPS